MSSGRSDDVVRALVTLAESVRDAASTQSRRWGHDAQTHLDNVLHEAGRRSSNAWDALAGRQQNSPWTAVLIGAAALGAGWMAHELWSRRAGLSSAIGEKAAELKAAVNEAKDGSSTS